jgi:hypothetical protein
MKETAMKLYAGIGSRETPQHIIIMMQQIAALLTIDGYTLSTGAAKGADQAFADGANKAHGHIHLHLPWLNYEEAWRKHLHYVKLFVLEDKDTEAFNSVSIYHPAFEKLTRGPIALHARNYNILTKPNPVEFIICYTKGGQFTGGTGQALRIATHQGIKIYNLGHNATLTAIMESIQNRKAELAQFQL